MNSHLQVVGIKGGDTLKEEWRDIPNLSPYQISNLGNVKNVVTGHILSAFRRNPKSYITYSLPNKDGKRITFRPHRMVAKLFIGEIPKGYHVHHKNGNKHDNRLENLEIISPLKHYQESRRLGQATTKEMNEYNQYVRPRKIEQYTLDGHLLATYCNSTIATDFTGVCQRNILQVANGDQGRKQAGGFIWKFADERKGVV